MDVSKEKFAKYEKVRCSGITNMFDVRRVCSLSGLDQEEVFHIMEHYEELAAAYPDIRKLD